MKFPLLPGLLLLCATLPLNADDPYPDAPWVRLGGIQSPYQVVRALAVDEATGRLYAGGDLQFASASRIGCWDGERWLPLGTGVNGPVHAVAFVAGQLYAGGLFTLAGGVPVSNIARWDGTAWHPVGAGVNGQVNALLVDGADVYAGGAFTASGGATVNHVARWDGTVWHALGAGTPGLNGPVHALAKDASGLHAGGAFTVGVTGNYAVFDGTGWSGGGPFPGTGFNGTVRVLSFHNGELHAGGDFTLADGFNAGRIARWNGAGFGPLFPGDTGMDAPVNALFSFGGELIAGGDFWVAGGVNTVGIARTDGVSWSAMDHVDLQIKQRGDKGVLAFAMYDGRLRAAGDIELLDGYNTNTGIVTWSGEAWQGVFGDGPNEEVWALTEHGGELYMAGGFTHVAGKAANPLARWDGVSWGPVGGGVNSDVLCLTSAGGQLYAGGHFTQAGGQPAARIARWEGSAWHQLGAGVAGGVVRAIAVHSGQVYAAGEFTSAGGQPASRIARWDGSAWHPLGAGLDGPVHAVAFYNGELYAGGDFETAGGVASPYLARWDGTAWSRVGTAADELSGLVRALAVYGGELYAGGEFYEAGSLVTGGIARWNGAAWSTVGGGIDDWVHALLVDGAELLVCGDFSLSLPGGNAELLARWDGTAWSRVSEGVPEDQWLNALARVGDRLYAGGDLFYDFGDSPEFLGYMELPASGAPELVVEQPTGVERAQGAVVDFGPLALGTASPPAAVVVRNTGTAALALSGVAVTGAAEADYTLDLTGLLTEVPAGGQTSFTLAFTPGGAVSGARAAQVEIGSDDADEHPFVLNLTGLALSTTADADVDGLNDWAEHRLAALGFDWQAGQPALVAALFEGAGAAGLFTAAQVQALHIGTPLLQQNAGTGVFTLTLGVEKSVTLEPESFQPFPVTAPQLMVNGQGKIEFHFTPADDAAFYLLRAQ